MDDMILSFEKAGLKVEEEIILQPLSFSLRRGELALFALQVGEADVPMADLAEGLIDPTEGAVAFKARSWRGYSPHDAAAARGRIGRVFASRGWLSNLDVDENIMLSERHHTTRPEPEIEAEAVEWARFFELPNLPRVRPSMMTLRRSELRRAEWIRAFMGRPDLIVLEEPMEDVYAQHLSALLRAIREARQRGTAFIWITKETQRPDAELDPSCRFRIEKGIARPF